MQSILEVNKSFVQFHCLDCIKTTCTKTTLYWNNQFTESYMGQLVSYYRSFPVYLQTPAFLNSNSACSKKKNNNHLVRASDTYSCKWVIRSRELTLPELGPIFKVLRVTNINFLRWRSIPVSTVLHKSVRFFIINVFLVKNFKPSKLKSEKWLGQSVNILSEWIINPGKGL